VVLSLFVIGQISQHALNKEINDNIEDLTKAIQFSVQNLTSEGVDSQSQIEQIVKNSGKRC